MKLTANESGTINRYLQDKPVIREYAFGSYAIDKANVQSDLDLLVELDYSQPIGLQFVGIRLDLEDRLWKAIDLVSINGLSPRIRPFIDNDKQLIYEREVQ